MSIPVAAASLAGPIEERGPTAYLVTVGGDDRPHVVAVTVGWHGESLVANAGRTTTANVALHPDVTLIWPARPGSGYSLIVDGRARSTDGDGPSSLAIDPRKAVLHRTPEGDPSSPSCITVLPPP
ncbi:MAG TPA: pyridoxamine 5'-phosphate oxidase family protein [Acidimicrobiales bacterium]|nr:pyridoxamine 5'-phosphate oxidase family protein [Acidimicrobiales bacterium]